MMCLSCIETDKYILLIILTEEYSYLLIAIIPFLIDFSRYFNLFSQVSARMDKKGANLMRKIVGLLFLCGMLGACSDKTFPPIDSSTDFVASLNTLVPSINFISENLETIETWKL